VAENNGRVCRISIQLLRKSLDMTAWVSFLSGREQWPCLPHLDTIAAQITRHDGLSFFFEWPKTMAAFCRISIQFAAQITRRDGLSFFFEWPRTMAMFCRISIQLLRKSLDVAA